MAPADSANQPSSQSSAETSAQIETPYATRSTGTGAARAAQATTTSPAGPLSHTNSAAIIAPVVILVLLTLAVSVFFLVRRRRRKQDADTAYTNRSLNHLRPSGSESNPLLVTPLAWPQTAINGVQAEEFRGAHSRVPSALDGTPHMRGLGHELEASESDTYTSSPRINRDILPIDPNRDIPPSRSAAEDAVLSPTSTYSQSSASTRVEQEVNGEALASSRWTLPPIPLSEPLTAEMLRANSVRDNNAGAPSRNPFSRGPSRSRSRGNSASARPRTILPNAPMSPLAEDSIASHGGGAPAPNSTDRWSSAADPGGSHPRPANTHPYQQSRPRSPEGSTGGSGFGFGLLTSAFRKSLSASSIASDTTNLHHAYPTHTNLLTANNTYASLQHFPSVDSLGASSGTGSSVSAGGTFYSAMSMSEFGAGRGNGAGTGSRTTRRDPDNIPPSLQPRSRAPSSRNSLSTYPSIPSLPSFSMRSSVGTAPPPVPSLPAGALAIGPRDAQTVTSPSGAQVPIASHLPAPDIPLPPVPLPRRQKSNTDPRVKAHLRPAPARRTGAHPGIARAGPSTHGVIDVVQRS
ncbi:hypothetical protein HWV62_2065 [Athelia sp. TMB]|nr:hypothetical protein HWV62_2065 [Athelia sp. TMB]